MNEINIEEQYIVLTTMLPPGVPVQKQKSTWSYGIFLKVRELAHYLTSKKEKLDFVNPEYEIERIDSYEIRQKILKISDQSTKKKKKKLKQKNNQIKADRSLNPLITPSDVNDI